jgi:apolipoprotein D and lipocalin family protein
MDRISKNKLLTAGAVALSIAAITLVSCNKRSIPKGVTAVTPFDLNKYLGSWYEIARFDFRFEKGLDHTTATYTRNKDGSIRVLNRGYNKKNDKWKSASGKAKFAGREDEAMLKVSFFGPFYAGYNVIAIDPEYKYALVAGDSRDYLWILSREKTIPANIKRDYLAKAESLGFDIRKLIWVAQN